MKLAINIFFCLFAGLLVFGAPDKYNYEYCVTLLVIFVINAIYYFATNKSYTGNAANFDFFFIFSYGMTNFIYPVFYKPYNPNFMGFEFPFNHDIITKSTAIAYLGFTFVALGLSHYGKRKKLPGQKVKREELPSFKVNNLFVRSIFVIAIISFVLYIVTGGLAHLQNAYSGIDGDLNEVGVFSYFNNIFVICANLLAVFVFLVTDKLTKILTFIFIIICSILMLTTGSRTVVLGLGLILICAYGRYVKRFSIPKMLLILFVGSLFMTFIQMSRKQEFSGAGWAQDAKRNVKVESPFDIFSDLIVNNRSLYVLVDFADEVQNVYFLSAISEFTAPIPGLFSYVSQQMNVPKELIFGGALPTFLELGPDSSFGLGTNLVGETYVGFSYFGVCIIMFLIGYVVKRTYRASQTNIYAFVTHFLLVSHAVFFSRSFYLYQPRTLVWSLVITLLLLKLTNMMYRKKIRQARLVSYSSN